MADGLGPPYLKASLSPSKPCLKPDKPRTCTILPQNQRKLNTTSSRLTRRDMQRKTRGRARPRIEPIKTDHGHFDGISKRLIPVRGESPPSSRVNLSSPLTQTGQNNSAISPLNTSLSGPLSASFFTRRGIQPDVFVMPVELPKGLRPAVKSSTRMGEVLSPIPDGGHYTVRVVVHSGNNRHFGLTRQFDVDALRATIPDNMSPRTPVLDKNLSLAILEGRSTSPLPESPAEVDMRPTKGGSASPHSGDSPLSEREARLGYRALPMGT
jgi:hypothetical protein